MFFFEPFGRFFLFRLFGRFIPTLQPIYSDPVGPFSGCFGVIYTLYYVYIPRFFPFSAFWPVPVYFEALYTVNYIK